MTDGAERPLSSIATWIESLDPGPDGPRADAAVLAVVRTEGASDEVLLLERAIRPNDPGSGQVGLPGGHRARADATMRATALRECEEEVGLRPDDFRIAPRYIETRAAPAFGLSVSVFAVILAPTARSARPLDPSEVAEVFWLPLGAIRTLVTRRRSTANGWRAVPAVVYDGHVVWGFTLRLLRQLALYARRSIRNGGGREVPRLSPVGAVVGKTSAKRFFVAKNT